MRIAIKATKTKLTPALRAYVNERVETLWKLVKAGDTSAQAWVEVGKTTAHHHTGVVFRAEINLHIAGAKLRAVSQKDDLYAAIDDAKAEMARQLRKIKTRRSSKMRRSASHAKNAVQRRMR